MKWEYNKKDWAGQANDSFAQMQSEGEYKWEDILEQMVSAGKPMKI